MNARNLRSNGCVDGTESGYVVTNAVLSWLDMVCIICKDVKGCELECTVASTLRLLWGISSVSAVDSCPQPGHSIFFNKSNGLPVSASFQDPSDTDLMPPCDFIPHMGIVAPQDFDPINVQVARERTLLSPAWHCHDCGVGTLPVVISSILPPVVPDLSSSPVLSLAQSISVVYSKPLPLDSASMDILDSDFSIFALHMPSNPIDEIISMPTGFEQFHLLPGEFLAPFMPNDSNCAVRHGQAIITCRLNDVEFQVLLDTGADTCVVHPSLIKTLG